MKNSFHYPHISLYFSLILLLSSLPSLKAQQTLNGSLQHDGQQRSYILYIPASYSPNTPIPLVFNFHGYTSNANDQMAYGDFRSIADTANFLVVHPQGTVLNGSTHWNVGGWTVGSTVDDVGFTSALIDALAEDYSIDLDRVYATGMSNGGYMSFLLACQLSDKIAAIASVTGSMTPEIYQACDPQHPMPIMQIHGTVDGVVPYFGTTWSRSIDDVMEYWVAFNRCAASPIVSDVPNTSTIDISTVEHQVYESCDLGIRSEHFKVSGGGHTWPGTIFSGPGTNQDINASDEIWKFFYRYDIHGPRLSTSVEQIPEEEVSVSVYPNPTTNQLMIQGNIKPGQSYEIYTLNGQSLRTGRLSSSNPSIDLTDLPSDVYLLKIGAMLKKIIKVGK